MCTSLGGDLTNDFSLPVGFETTKFPITFTRNKRIDFCTAAYPHPPLYLRRLFFQIIPLYPSIYSPSASFVYRKERWRVWSGVQQGSARGTEVLFLQQDSKYLSCT